MSRRHQPGRRVRVRRKEPEVIVLAKRVQQEPCEEREPESEVKLTKPRDTRAEVIADMREEARRWK